MNDGSRTAKSDGKESNNEQVVALSDLTACILQRAYILISKLFSSRADGLNVFLGQQVLVSYERKGRMEQCGKCVVAGGRCTFVGS